MEEGQESPGEAEIMTEETVEFTRKEIEILVGMIASGALKEAQGFLISKSAQVKKRIRFEYAWGPKA
jgi:hypothetical protein